MPTPTGPDLWSTFTRLRDSAAGFHRFGELPVTTVLCAGDGGTFACHVRERAKKGTWSLYRFGTDDFGAVMALRDGSTPVRWDDAGAIIIDSSVGTFVPIATLEEIENPEGDPDDLTDAIDEALFGADEDEAVLETLEGRKPFAVFQLGGDGTYPVVKGLDEKAAVCAMIVIC